MVCAMHAWLLHLFVLLGCSMAVAKPMVGTQFLTSARDIDLVRNTVVLPLHPAVLPSGTKTYFIVTEASTAAAASGWGASHAPILSALKDTPQVQVVRGASTPGSVLQVPATVNFTHGKRSVTPNPTTGFPPTSFSFSAQGNQGYTPLLQLPDGTILNAPQVAVQAANGSLTTHPKVLSVSPNMSSVVFALTPGFSDGQPIVYISTEASDPLAATLENVPLVPVLADTPSAVLIDLVAFTNGQTGSSNPQRQGLSSAIKDGMSPLNIAANTPAATAAYSPLWAVNLAKWVGQPGDRQTSVQDVQALAAEGKVASFSPKDPASNPPLSPSGIVVNCPIIATVRDPMVGTQFLTSARDIDLVRNTVVLPLHPAVLPSGTKTYFIVTEASTAAAASGWGASHAPILSALKDTPQVQVVRGASTPGSVLQVPATVNFTHGKRSVTPNPTTGFPPTSFSFSAQGNQGYTPLLQLPDGTILNAPQVAVQAANGSLTTHPKVLSVSPNMSSVVFALTPGFSDGQPIVYISTEASDPLAATLENVPLVPVLADTPSAVLIDLVAFTNGQTGSSNPQRQGLSSAIKDGMSPLNIAANTPAATAAYSPLWAVNLAKWVGQPGDRQTSVQDVQALAAEGKVASFSPKDPASNPPLSPSGIVVNCPIIATVRDTNTAAGQDRKRGGGKQTTAGEGTCTPSPLGYSCVVDAQQGVRIHYTLGGKTPPSNMCTRTTTTTGTSMDVISAPVDASGMVHLLLEANNPGYLAVSFPKTATKMWPADAVIGASDALGTMPEVKSYHLTQYGVSAADETSGWASNLGLVAPSAGAKLLCFSRALNAPAAAVVKSIDPNAALPMNWALGSQSNLVHHTSRGSLSISLTGGRADVDASDSAASDAFRIAHGALMCAAFVLMMPTAVLMARHKWMFGDKESGDIKSGWFNLHKFINAAAAVLALAAVIVIFVRFRWAGRAETTTYYTGHRAVGMTTIAMMLAQVVLGSVRPHLGGRWRPLWMRAHQAWGWLLLLTGTASSYMGIALFHDLSDLPLAYWLGPAIAATGSLLVCGLVLEARKHKLESSDRYNKEEHTVGPSKLPKAGKAVDMHET